MLFILILKSIIPKTDFEYYDELKKIKISNAKVNDPYKRKIEFWSPLGQKVA